MKKFILSIIATVYLLASTGTAVELHYCMGKMVDWSIALASSPSCAKCGMEKQAAGNDCCKDEQKYVKSVDDQKAGSIQYAFSPLVFAAEPSAFHLPPFILASKPRNFVGSANGPPIAELDLFLQHRSFLL